MTRPLLDWRSAGEENKDGYQAIWYARGGAAREEIREGDGVGDLVSSRFNRRGFARLGRFYSDGLTYTQIKSVCFPFKLNQINMSKRKIKVDF
jgi:hypothetical protein